MKLLGLFTIGAIILFIISGCELAKPEMPTWNINIDLPLMNDYWYVSDLVDSVHFFQDGNDVYFSSHGNINSFVLSNLQIQPNAAVTIPLFADITSNGALSLASISSTDQVRVAYGKIQSGFLQVTSSNLSTGYQGADIQFNELFNQNGEHLVVHTGNVENTSYFDLSGVIIGSLTNTTTIDSLHYTINTQSTLPNATPIGEIQLVLNQLVHFDNFIGLMDNFTLNVENETNSINVEYPLGIENAVQITNASLQLDLINQIGFDCELHGKLYAYNDNTGISDSISILDDNGHPFILRAATSETNYTANSFILHNGLDTLTNIIPTRLSVKNAYFVMKNSSQSLGFAHLGQRVTGSYIEHVPFDFTLYNTQIIPQHLYALEITPENREYVKKNVNSAILLLKVKNQLPVGMSVEVDFSSNPDVFANIELSRTGTIAIGGYDSDFQEITFDMTKEDLQLFDNERVYYKLKINIQPTNGPIVLHGSTSDYIEIMGRIKMNALVEIEGK